MLKIEWRQTAREDLLAIIGFIADHNPEAAQRLKDGDSIKSIPLQLKRERLRRDSLWQAGRIVLRYVASF